MEHFEGILNRRNGSHNTALDAYVCVEQLRMCVLSDVQGVLTRTPENVLVLRGQDAVLSCSTNETAGQNPITWNYDNTIISHEPCTSQSHKFVTFPPDSATDCNLRASGSNGHNNSGPYRCIENSQRAVAMVIVLGKLHCTVM